MASSQSQEEEDLPMDDCKRNGESELVTVNNESKEGHPKKRDKAKRFLESLKGRKTWTNSSSKQDKRKIPVKDDSSLVDSKSATLPARSRPVNNGGQERSRESGSASLQRKFRELFKISSSDSVVVDSASDEEMNTTKKDSDLHRDSGVDVSSKVTEFSGEYSSREVRKALGPSMRDVGKLLTNNNHYSRTPPPLPTQNSLSDEEEEWLSSRPPLPLPPEATKTLTVTPVVPPRSQSRHKVEEDDGLYEKITSRNTGQRLKVQLQQGLKDLAHHGWYWGPITRVQAEERLEGLPNGAFLVRDSADDRYMLSLSFRSEGRTLHSRIEYSHFLFSFYTFPDADNDGYPTVVELIRNAMSFSQDGIFCFSRARNDASPTIPVRLTQPVSRFTKVRSLQDHCRFTIRQVTRFDQLRNLPLPKNLGDYLEQSPFSTDTR
jgi:suppressor of cytokine signaling 7